MDKNKLTAKNCPFCGGRPQLNVRYNEHYYFYVQCKTCGAKSGTRSAFTFDELILDDERSDQIWDDEGARQALELWNRRSGEEK